MCVAGEHRVAVPLELGRVRQIDQQPQRVAGDAVLGVVDVQVADGDVELAAAVRVLVEELAQMGLTDLAVVLLQRTPCRGR